MLVNSTATLYGNGVYFCYNRSAKPKWITLQTILKREVKAIYIKRKQNFQNKNKQKRKQTNLQRALDYISSLLEET